MAIPPGDSIRENMEMLGMNQEELAARLGITTKHLSHVLNGFSPVTYETALRLESVIGASAEFWMNLEMHYQLHKSRIQGEENLTAEIEMLKSIQYKSMSEHGWVSKAPDKAGQVRETREFFGVGRLEYIEPAYSVAFKRQLPKVNDLDLGTLAWIRKAEIEGIERQVSKFSRMELKALIPQFKSLVCDDARSILPRLQTLCAGVGVAFVMIESLPKVDICGATLWRNGRGILALGDNTINAGLFWETLRCQLDHLSEPAYKDLNMSFLKDFAPASPKI
jgi:HTH-type transcriptional regulator/antitoxin HigA